MESQDLGHLRYKSQKCVKTHYKHLLLVTDQLTTVDRQSDK